jgi:hypothetical protein
MKKLSFVIGVLALGLVASAPARADFVVVKFDPGYCRIWWDSSMKPYGTGWHVVGRPYGDWPAAWAALSAAWTNRTCL